MQMDRIDIYSAADKNSLFKIPAVHVLSKNNKSFGMQNKFV
jgi:hypothetical protein